MNKLLKGLDVKMLNRFFFLKKRVRQLGMKVLDSIILLFSVKARTPRMLRTNIKELLFLPFCYEIGGIPETFW